MKLDIYRNSSIVASIPVSDSSQYSYQLMGEHKITCPGIVVTDVLPIQLGDYILYDGERYSINKAPGYQKHHNLKHEYNITFEAIEYRLYDKKLMQNGEFITDYFGYPKLFLQLIVENINEIDPGWSVGEVAVMDELHIEFSDKPSCRNALTQIAQAFKLEYYFTGKVIHLVKSAGAQTSLVFSQGRGNGLYTFELTERNDSSVVTRVYGFGAEKNIPANYRLNEAGIPAKRIRLPTHYIEKNVEYYGVKEGIYQNDEIFPNRTSTLTGVGGLGLSTFEVSDSTLDFDINTHLLEGLEAKVVFKSGDLAGYEFTISKYDPAQKLLLLNIDKNQQDFPIPNSTFIPKPGDKYTLVDMRMPDSYVVAAEALLESESLTFLEENCIPKLAFSLNLDELHVRRNGIRLKPGDRVRVQEPQLGVDSMIRTTSVSWPILNPDRISAVIADFIPYTLQEKLISASIENRTETLIVDRINAERARENARQLRLLKDLIRDPDGYFDPGGIKPGSIETLYLSVGAKSQNFGLNNVLIQANYQGDPNAVHISSGQLIHYEMEIEGLGYVWQMQEQVFTGLEPGAAYYIAARCERYALRGTWSLTQDFKKAEQEPGVWYFNLGVLYPVVNGYRNYDLTKGMTTIVGENITTGKIQSIDKINFFNLTNGTFNLGSGDTGIDYGVTTPGVLTIKKSIMAERVEVGSGGVVNAFISGITDAGEYSVRFAAGEEMNFRVLDNGDVYMNKAYMADGCRIGDFDISGGGIVNREGGGFIRITSEDNTVGATIGPNLTGVQGSEGTMGGAVFHNRQDNPNGVNTAVYGFASGGLFNYGGYFGGGVYINGSLVLEPREILSGGSHTLDNNTACAVWQATGGGILYLPPEPPRGMTLTFYKYYTGPEVRIHGNGGRIFARGQNIADFKADMSEQLYYDGTVWNRK